MTECNSTWLRENWIFVYFWIAYSIRLFPVLIIPIAWVGYLGMRISSQLSAKKVWYFSTATVLALSHFYIVYALHIISNQCNQLSVPIWWMKDEVILDQSEMALYKWLTLIISFIIPISTWKLYKSGQWLMRPSEFRQSVKRKKWWKW